VETDGKVLHQPIIVDDVSAKHARAGDRVVVQITEYPLGEKMSRGVVLELLGPEGEPDVELRAVMEEFDLPREFPTRVDHHLQQIVDKFNRTVGAALEQGKMPKDRLDLRDKIVITIDPVDARDFDDAISIDQTDRGYELGVHIADVSAFVQEDSPIDLEARDRGNSVYLPRLVLPMIPEALSNGLCSLQEGRDRLTKSVFIRYDPNGKVLGARYANSVIRSTKRLTYEQASAVLAGSHKTISKPVVDLLLRSEKLARAIWDRRAKEGMLHLDLPEVELDYNEKGELVDAHPADTSFSHTIIEMFMVEANEAVARLLDSYNIPFLRRIHPDPSPEAFSNLRDFLLMLGHRIAKDPDRQDLQQLIDTVADKPDSFAVSYAVLRALQRATYSPQKIGHYALASRHYCHFTSPIRRYADLTIHRLLQHHFEGKLKNLVAKLRQEEKKLVQLGEHIAFTEQRAEEAERQIKEVLILQLLSEHIGEHFDGLVTGIATLGPFVRLPKYQIEGLLPIEELGNDIWEVNQDGGYIRGRRHGRRFKIGDSIKVSIVSIDTLTRRMNLSLVEELPTGKKVKKIEKGKMVRKPKSPHGGRLGRKTKHNRRRRR